MAAQADLADSNMANYGSDEHRELRRRAAESEPEFVGAGSKPGLEIWRVEKLAVKRWPKEEYGNFFAGDSFIVMNTYTEGDSAALHHDCHFWLGAHTSQDEMGVAAYKTVELDDLLGDVPVQHREVQDHESELFMSYFEPSHNILEGGIESGFNHVEPEEYEPRLLHIAKIGKQIRVTQVPMTIDSLHHGDSFILDAGTTLYQWDGDNASAFERHKSGEICAGIKSDRHGRCNVTNGDDEDEFWEFLGGRGDVQDAIPPEQLPEVVPTTLLKLSDETGELVFEKVAEAPLSRDMLDSNDAFVLDAGHEIFVWVGANASAAERKHAIPHAMRYLEASTRPNFLPITRIIEGGESVLFERAFGSAQ